MGKWGQIFILDFTKNIGVIHKKVGVFKCGIRNAEFRFNEETIE